MYNISTVCYIEFADHVLYMHRRKPLWIYTSYIHVHPFIGCGDHVDTMLTETHESWTVCVMHWFAECRLFYETCGVQCLLSESVCGPDKRVSLCVGKWEKGEKFMEVIYNTV